MSRCLIGLSLIVAATTLLSAQKPAEKDAAKDDTLTMSGCVVKNKAPQDPLTFADDGGFRYRLSGKSVKKYSGKRVELVGLTPVAKRFAIKGGLFPSPNVAAQAGALDPAKAAIAAQPGGGSVGTGTSDVASLPEFKVTRIRELDGSCR